MLRSVGQVSEGVARYGSRPAATNAVPTSAAGTWFSTMTLTTSSGFVSSHTRRASSVGASSVAPISHNPWHRYSAGGPVGGPMMASTTRSADATTSGPNASSSCWRPSARSTARDDT